MENNISYYNLGVKPGHYFTLRKLYLLLVYISGEEEEERERKHTHNSIPQLAIKMTKVIT